MPNWGGGAQGALGGAATGASIGAMGGPIGVGVGTVGGAVVGGLAGLFGGGGGGGDLPSYADLYQNMQDFQLPSQFQVDPNSFDPYLANAQAMISRGYGAAREGVQGAMSQYQNSPGYAALRGAANRGKRAYNFALGQRKEGEATLSDRVAEIEQLEAGGYDIFNDPQALAEIAPEVMQYTRGLNDAMADMDAWGVRGGVGASQRADLVRSSRTQAQDALQQAILRNRGEKLGISEAKATRDALADPNMQAYLALANGDMQQAQLLASLYGQEAGAQAGLGGQYFSTTAGAITGNADRALKAFGLLTNGEITLEQAQAELDAKERAQLNEMMRSAGTAASAYNTPRTTPGQTPMTMPSPGSAPLTQPLNAPSDKRLKDDPGRVRSALKDVAKLPVYDYHYNALAGELAGTPGRGLMAQDLEKNPRTRHLVHKDPDGVRSVDVYGVASTALAAVQELDQKLKRLERKKWRLSGKKVA